MAGRIGRPRSQARERSEKGAWRKAFLTALRNTANIRYACEQAKVSRKTAYQHKAVDAAFAEAWADALEDACDALEMLALTRAQQGSDTILMKLLSAHRPEKYREGFEQNVQQIVRVSNVHVSMKELLDEVPLEVCERLLAKLEQRDASSNGKLAEAAGSDQA